MFGVGIPTSINEVWDPVVKKNFTILDDRVLQIKPQYPFNNNLRGEYKVVHEANIQYNRVGDIKSDGKF